MKKRYYLVATIFFIFLLLLVFAFADSVNVWKKCYDLGLVRDQAFLSKHCCKDDIWEWRDDLPSGEEHSNCKPSVSVSHSPSLPSPTNNDDITITATSSDDESGVKNVKIYVDLNQDSDYVDSGEQKELTTAPYVYGIGKFLAGTRICYYAFAYDNYDHSDFTSTQCFTVNSATCSVYEDSPDCEGNSNCNWCSKCSGNKYSGGSNRCVGAETCSYFCLAGQCSAACTASTDSLWSGTLCSSNCDIDSTCTYLTCTTKCSSSNTYCKGSDNYCYYGVGCTGSGCTATEGDSCPTGTCDLNGNCAIPCTLSQALITCGCSSDGNPTCAPNEYISMSASFTGSCTTGANTYFQIDAKSTDGVCNIEFAVPPGDMSGMTKNNPTISGTSYSGTWTVPSIPADCSGKTVYAWAAAIWNGTPGSGTWITGEEDTAPIDSSVDGSCTFISVIGATTTTTTIPGTTTTTTTIPGTTTTTTTTTIPGTTCEDDCTYAGDNIIHKECDGINGCNFCDGRSKEVCNFAQPGWIREYDATHEIECAEGCSREKREVKATVTCEKENLIKLTKLVTYKGKLVKLVVIACG